MAVPALGRGAAIGFGEESTWGTAVARTNWRPLVSAGIIRNVEKVAVPDLKAGGAATRRRHVTLSDDAGGRFRLVATYENLGMLLKHLLGAVTTTGAAAPYTHDFTLAADLPEGLTMEIVRGTSPTSEVFEGCLLNEGTFRCDARGVAQWDFDVIAETSATRSTPGTPSYGAAETPIVGHHAGQLSFNSANYDLVGVELRVRNNLARRPRLGSKLTQRPSRDWTAIELQVQLEAQDALYNALLADTTGDVTFGFQSGTNQFNITLHNAYLVEASDPIENAGRIMQTVRFVGESDGTNEGLALQLVNDNASAIAN